MLAKDGAGGERRLKRKQSEKVSAGDRFEV